MKRYLIWVIVILAVLLVYTLVRPWNLRIRIFGDSPDLKFEIRVDGTPVGHVQPWETLDVRIPSGEHIIELILDGRTIVEREIDLPFISISKRADVDLELPNRGEIEIRGSYLDEVYRISVDYDGVYPIDSFSLILDGEEFTSISGDFVVRSKEKSIRFKVKALKDGVSVLERYFEVSRNRGELNVVLKGDERLKDIAKISIDGVYSGSRELEFGEHEIRVDVDGLQISTTVFLEDDSTIVVDLPKLARIVDADLEVRNGSVVISWNVDDGIEPSGYEISWYGNSTNVVGTEIELPLERSTVVYTITPIFFGGKISGDDFKVVKPAFPKLVVEVPDESSSCALKVKVSSNAPFKIFLNGSPSSETLHLVEGENFLRVVAEDEYGQISTFEKTILCDRTPPSLEYSIEDESIRFETDEDAKLEIKGFGIVEVGSPLSLRALPSEFVITATDRLGNSTSVKIRMIEKPDVRAEMVDLDDLRVEIHYKLPRDGFELNVDGSKVFIDGDSTVLKVVISKFHTISVRAVYGKLKSDPVSIEVVNPFVEILSGEVSDLKPGYYLVEDRLKLVNVASTNVEIFVKDGAFIRAEGDLSGLKFSPAEDSWEGLRFEGGTVSDLEISGARICIHLNGESVLSGVKMVGCGIGIKAMNVELKISDSYFENCGVGIDVSNTDLEILKTRFEGCEIGLRARASKVVLDSSEFEKSETGLELIDSSLWIYNSRLISNSKGMKTFKSSVYAYSTDFEDNEIAVEFYRHTGINAFDGCVFKFNELDVLVKGERDIFTNTGIEKVVDGNVKPFWLDDRGVLRRRGRVLKVGDR